MLLSYWLEWREMEAPLFTSNDHREGGDVPFFFLIPSGFAARGPSLTVTTP